MEIKGWLCYASNFVLVCCIVAKPFSLNELIEAESNQKEVYHTTVSPKLEETQSAAERFSLNKGLKPLSHISKKLKEKGASLSLISLGKKISPFKYRKAFQIKSPLKPKRVKNSLRTRHKRKNQSVKTEIDGNALLNQKYIPLLKSLGMLFDNILGPDSGASIEIPKGQRKRLRYYFADDDTPCKCAQEESTADSESGEKTIASSEVISFKVSATTEATTPTTDNTPAGNLRSFRRNKNVPILLPRNTISPGRDNYGLSERSRPTHNGSDQGHISGAYGNSEHNPEWGQDKSNAESDEKYTNNDSRNGTSGVRTRGTIRNRGSPRTNTEENEAVNENETISNETENLLDGLRRYIDEFHGQDKFKAGRDETESTNILPEPIRGQGGLPPKSKVEGTAKPLQSKQDNKESYFDVAQHSPDDQRIFDRDGTSAPEDQKVDARYETIVAQNVLQVDQLRIDKEYKESSTNTAHHSSSNRRMFDKDGKSVFEDHDSDERYVTIMEPNPLKKDQLRFAKSNEESYTNIAQHSSVNQQIFDSDNTSDSYEQKVDVKHKIIVTPNALKDDQLRFTIEEGKESYSSIAQRNSANHRIFDRDSTSASEEIDKTIMAPNVPEMDQPREKTKDIYFDVAQHRSSNQPIFDRDGTSASKEQTTLPRYDRIIVPNAPKVDQPRFDSPKRNKTTRNGPVVVIIDGYSVTRHKNGENKLAKQAIRIRP